MKLAIAIFTIVFFTIMFTSNTNAQTVTNSNSPEKQMQADKPVKIKSKPRVPYTQGTCEQKSGSVSIRVTFDKSKKITNAQIAKSSGCDRFDERAVTAAKKIKFSPAVKNGEPTTVTLTVQYTFDIF